MMVTLPATNPSSASMMFQRPTETMDPCSVRLECRRNGDEEAWDSQITFLRSIDHSVTSRMMLVLQTLSIDSVGQAFQEPWITNIPPSRKTRDNSIFRLFEVCKCHTIGIGVR